MEFDWKDVQEEGVLPSIQTPEAYQIGIETGFATMREILTHRAAPITSPENLKEIHKHLFEHVSPWAGKFHWKQHLIGGTPGSDPDMRENELNLLGEQMRQMEKTETNEQNVIRVAAFYHIRLVTCHVFSDGNGRVSRALCDHYLQTRLGKQIMVPFGKRPYIEALKQSRETENLAPLANVFSIAWLGHPEKEREIPSPFRLTPLQIEPLKKTWLEATTKGKIGWENHPKKREQPTLE